MTDQSFVFDQRDCMDEELDQRKPPLERRAEVMSDVKPIDEQIEYILNNFNFDAVKETMVALNWWWGSPGHIPTFNELRCTAKDLLQEAAKVGYMGTGGFEAILLEDTLSLAFVVESQGGEDNGDDF